MASKLFQAFRFYAFREFGGSCTIRPKTTTTTTTIQARKKERKRTRWTCPIKLKLEHPSHFLEQQNETNDCPKWMVSARVACVCVCLSLFFSGNLCVDSEKWQTTQYCLSNRQQKPSSNLLNEEQQQKVGSICGWFSVLLPTYEDIKQFSASFFSLYEWEQ